MNRGARGGAADNELVFLPLGGCGEIGMNLNLFGYGPPAARQWLMIDLGVTFGDLTTPGVDVIMPDPSYIEEYADDLVGLVLTHGHEDHIGAVAYLWPRLECPVYATPFTATLLKAKLAEAGIEKRVPLNIIPLGSRFQLGPFDLELITLTHSILEPNAVAVRTPLGTVLHTGDWKIDPDPILGKTTDEDCLRALGDEGVLAMVCDSTNVLSPGTSGSEGDVRESLIDLIPTLKNRVAVTSFASNLARLETVAAAAAAADRHVVLVGRSMHKMVDAAKAAGYLASLPTLVDEEEAGYLPPDKVLYLCTGSQGEARAALARIADDNHPSVTLEAGDTVVFSSRIIPGNELSIFALQNQLAERGVHIITEKDHFVHVSGHPCRDELQQMYGWVRPRIAVPVHGEMRHLHEHALLAGELQIAETPVVSNGDMLRLAPGPAEVVDEVPTGRLYLDGGRLVGASHPAFRERRKLSFGGAVFVSLAVDGKGQLAADAEVVLAGIPHPGDGSLEDAIGEAVENAIDRRGRKSRKDDADLEEAARRAVRGVLRSGWSKRPLVEIGICRVDD